MNNEELKKAFFVNTMEIRNETDKPILAKIVKVTTTGNIFIYIVEDRGYEVKPHNYKLVPIEEVSF